MSDHTTQSSYPTDSVKLATPADDLLWGAAAIAEYIGVPVDRVYYMVRKKKLPIAKLGEKSIVASRKELKRALAAITSTAA